MSIFHKKEIKVGDLVIGKKKYGWDNKGAATMERHFVDPSLVLQLEDHKALVYFEQQGPRWYNIDMLERVYVTDEFENVDRRPLAAIEFNYSDQSRDQDDNGDK